MDRGEIISLWLDLIEYHRCLDPHFPALPGVRERLREELARALDSERCRVFVAEECGKLVAFVFAEVEPNEAWVHELYVVPGSRRCGIATALVQQAQAFIEELGSHSLSVRVETENRGGLRFWRRRGFFERARVLTRD